MMTEQAGRLESQLPEGESVHTMTTRSRHSSMHGPYREGNPESNQFAFCNKVFSAPGSSESYSRSLLSLGNGYPIFDVLGDRKRSTLHLKRGPGLGDVGLLTTRGDFTFLFNIFADVSDPIHINETPPGFIPMKFPEPTEMTQRLNHFPPGTVLASKAIGIHRVSDSPLELIVSTTAREGGVLVLPDGASREDLTPSPALLQYIEQHALDWYLHAPEVLRGSHRSITNGSLYLITGCDKTQSVSCVAVPSASQHSGRKISIRYKQDEERPWSNEAQTVRIGVYGPKSNPGAWYGVFVRGIRISLNHHIWSRNLKSEPPNGRPFCNILSTPITRSFSRIIRLFEVVFSPRDTTMGPRAQVPFHPADIIAQIILKDFDSEIVIVEDSVWTRHVDLVSGDGTLSEIVKLLVRVLLAHDVLPGKLGQLVSKSKPTSDQNIVSRVQLKGLRDRWRVERKIKKVSPPCISCHTVTLRDCMDTRAEFVPLKVWFWGW